MKITIHIFEKNILYTTKKYRGEDESDFKKYEGIVTDCAFIFNRMKPWGAFVLISEASRATLLKYF